MPEILYERPYLYPKQEAALFHPKRWGLIEATTKAGKTVGCIAWIIEQAVKAPQYANLLWVAPVSSQAAIAFTRLKQGLPPGTFGAKETPVPRIDLINQTTIWCKSGDNADSIYGEDYYAAVIDEASRCKEDVWHAVRSTLTATSGPARIIGNVKGRKNWFYEWSRRAENNLDPNAIYQRLTCLDAIDAGVISQEEIEDARRNLPEHVFNELYMAIPSADSGNPFGEDHIYACVSRGLSKKPPTAFGIDLAKRADWLVIIGLDQDGNVCSFHRWQGRSWQESIPRIHEIVGEDTPALVDSTGIGDPVLEQLQINHGNFRGYNFSTTSKQKLMEGLAVAIQSREISFPDGQIKTELLGFEYKIMPNTGRTLYQAAEGYNDDCVCALALAREQWSTVAPGANLIAYLEQKYKEQKNESNENVEMGFDGPAPPFGRIAPRMAENELTELYRETLKQFEPEKVVCRRCAEPIGQNRVSDGMYVWHPQCF